MKTAMQELRDDLVKSLETGNEALNEITDEKLREICQKVAQLTLESIIKRIDEELLEMENRQKKQHQLAINCLIDFVDAIDSEKVILAEEYENAKRVIDQFKQQETETYPCPQCQGGGCPYCCGYGTIPK
jgi:intergrase/recombinase